MARSARRGIERGPVVAERAYRDVHRAVVKRRRVHRPQRLEACALVGAAAEADQGPAHALAIGATGRLGVTRIDEGVLGPEQEERVRLAAVRETLRRDTTIYDHIHGQRTVAPIVHCHHLPRDRSQRPQELRPGGVTIHNDHVGPRERSAPSAAPGSIAQGTGTTSVHLSRSSASTVGSGVTTKLTLAPAAAAASASAVQRATWPRPDSAPPSVMKAKRVRSVTDQLPHLGRREPDAVRVARVSEARSRSLAPFPGAKGPGGVERLDHEHLVVLERLAALVLGDEDLVELFPGAA